MRNFGRSSIFLVMSLAACSSEPIAASTSATATASSTTAPVSSSAASSSSAYSAPAPASSSGRALELAGIAFQIPVSVLPERLGEDAKPFGEAVNKLKPVITQFDRDHPRALGDAIEIWLGLKPGGKVKAWIGAAPEVTAHIRSDFATTIEANMKTEVLGLVVVVLKCNRTGTSATNASMIPPELLPKGPSSVTIEKQVLSVWPD